MVDKTLALLKLFYNSTLPVTRREIMAELDIESEATLGRLLDALGTANSLGILHMSSGQSGEKGALYWMDFPKPVPKNPIVKELKGEVIRTKSHKRAPVTKSYRKKQVSLKEKTKRKKA